MTVYKPSLPILNKSHPLAHGLIGAWLMYEGVGANSNDTGLRPEIATLGGNLTWSRETHGPVIVFPGGATDYINFGDWTGLDGATSATFVIRMKQTSQDLGRKLLIKLAGVGNRSFQTAIDDIVADELDLDIWQGSLRYLIRSTNANLVNDTWYDLVFVWRGGNDGNIYKDGVLLTHSTSTATTPLAITNSSTPFYIGYSVNSGTRFAGEIAHAMVYRNRALTPQEIVSLHTDPYQAFRVIPNYRILNLSTATFTSALTWTDNSTDETLFSIERSSTSASAGFAEIDTVAADVVSYNDAGLSAGDYWYRMRSYDGSNYSNYSNVIHAELIETPARGILDASNTLVVDDSNSVVIDDG